MYQGKIFEMCTTFKPLFKHSIILKSRLKIYIFIYCPIFTNKSDKKPIETSK